jgi:hypothetical protein
VRTPRVTPDNIEDKLQDALHRLEVVERAQVIIDRNQSDVAKSLTAIVEDHSKTKDVLDQLRTDREVRQERDKHLNERLDRIEKSIARLYNLGWWVLTAFGATLIAAVANFLVKGGFDV